MPTKQKSHEERLKEVYLTDGKLPKRISCRDAETEIKKDWLLLEPHQVHTIIKYPTAQQIDGNWYVPKWGSDTIQKTLERIREKHGD